MRNSEITKAGIALLVFVGVVAAVGFFSTEKTVKPAVIDLSSPALPDMTAEISPDEMRDALEHMKAAIDKAAKQERRRPAAKHPDIPGLEYQGTTDRGGHWHPAR